MLKKTITYTDYDGVERTENFYFNLTKAELMEMELSIAGGMKKMLERIIQADDMPKLMKEFKDLILRAYGEKSADGKRFVKSKELSEAFSQTEAYSELFMKLITDDKEAASFVNGVVPKDLAESAQAQMQKEAK